MTNEERTLLMIKATITGLPEDQQDKIRDLADTFRSFIKVHGGEGLMAFALVGAEISAEA